MQIAINGLTPNAKPEKGYFDYRIVVEFEDDEIEDDDAARAYRRGVAEALKAHIKLSNWMWCRVTADTNTQFAINYGFDSGD